MITSGKTRKNYLCFSLLAGVLTSQKAYRAFGAFAALTALEWADALGSIASCELKTVSQLGRLVPIGEIAGLERPRRSNSLCCKMAGFEMVASGGL